MGIEKLNIEEEKRILLIDDEKEVIESYKLFLCDSLYDVHSTYSSQKAWQLLEKNHFDLIITDLDMPFLSGEEFIQIVRKNELHQNVPIIIASGNINKLHESLEKRDPKLFLIKKPFGQQELIEKINLILK